MERHGFSAILLVMGAAFLLMVWGVAQQFVTGSVQRRVRIAEAGRRCLLKATMAVEEGIDLIRVLANEPGDAGEDGESLALGIRRLRPGKVLEFAYRPPPQAEESEGLPVELGDLRVIAYVQSMQPSRGPSRLPFGCQDYEEALRRWSHQRLSPLARQRAKRRLYGDWRPAELRGTIEFHASAWADVSRVRVTRRLRVRRQFQIQVSPCPEVLARVTGHGLGSLLEINPVELARIVESGRRPVPGSPPR